MSRCYIYIMAVNHDGAPPLVKIGIANNPASRLSAIQTACPFRIELARAYALPNREMALKVERLVHRSYSGARTKGEWFSLTEADAINAVVSAIGVSILVQLPDVMPAQMRETMACFGVEPELLDFADFMGEAA